MKPSIDETLVVGPFLVPNFKPVGTITPKINPSPTIDNTDDNNDDDNSTIPIHDPNFFAVV